MERQLTIGEKHFCSFFVGGEELKFGDCCSLDPEEKKQAQVAKLERCIAAGLDPDRLHESSRKISKLSRSAKEKGSAKSEVGMFRLSEHYDSEIFVSIINAFSTRN